MTKIPMYVKITILSLRAAENLLLLFSVYAKNFSDKNERYQYNKCIHIELIFYKITRIIIIKLLTGSDQLCGTKSEPDTTIGNVGGEELGLNVVPNLAQKRWGFGALDAPAIYSSSLQAPDSVIVTLGM